MGTQNRIFQSQVQINPGSEELAVSLVLFSSLYDSELNEKSSELLHSTEIATSNSYVADIRRRSFLHGRIAGKIAINQIFPEVPPYELEIITGSLGEPHIKNLAQLYGISIAHNESWNAGLCFPLSVPMGVDVETINEKNRPIIKSILSHHENELCDKENDNLEFLHILWTAKEAAGKAIRLGFRVPHEWYEIDGIETIMSGPHEILRCRFKQLSLFMTISVSFPGGILSIAYPAEKQLDQSMIKLLEIKTF